MENSRTEKDSIFIGRILSLQKEEQKMKLEDFIPITIIISPADPDESPEPRRRRFRVPSMKKIKWASLLHRLRNWAKEPINMGLIIWLLAVSIGLIIYVLLIADLLNSLIPQSSVRKIWIEVDNQILNALFTILCIYQSPRLLRQLLLLLRWTTHDADELRSIYSKKINGPTNERLHLGIVITLLLLTCCSQYVICGLFWGFNRWNRPEVVLNSFVGIGTLCPVVTGVCVLFGPLGRAGSGGDAAAPPPDRSPAAGEWAGGVFDCCEDKPIFCLSFFCTFCVFGWNMEKLGFGNMVVHTVTFALVIVSPLLVFNVAAMKIENEVLKMTMAISGAVLSFLGLIYGGFWRTQMRRRLNLPGNSFFCGFPNFSDCFQWLFCWSCSLAQEVRTGRAYSGEKGSPAPEKKAEECGGAAGKIRSFSLSGFPGIWEKPMVEFSLRSVSSPGRIYGLLPVLGHPAKVAGFSHGGDGSEILPPRAPKMSSEC